MLNKVLRKLSCFKKKIEFKYHNYLFKKYTRKALIPFDENWFKGKRVAIVGGADSVFNEKFGEYIDSFDVVVRINKGVEVIEQQKEYVGTKTDVLFHAFYERVNDKGSSPITPLLWKKNSVRTIIFSHNFDCSDYSKRNFTDILFKTKGSLKFSQVKKYLYDKNMKGIAPYSPTTGFIAINTIFNCLPKEIYITGITFFKTPHQKDYRNTPYKSWEKLFKNGSSKHNPEAEYEYVKKLYLKNKYLIKPDKILKDIFDTN
ncbi:glycosyltransferase family 29 protein [Empedobacter tilapiae]